MLAYPSALVCLLGPIRLSGIWPGAACCWAGMAGSYWRTVAPRGLSTYSGMAIPISNLYPLPILPCWPKNPFKPPVSFRFLSISPLASRRWIRKVRTAAKAAAPPVPQACLPAQPERPGWGRPGLPQHQKVNEERQERSIIQNPPPPLVNNSHRRVPYCLCL